MELQSIIIIWSSFFKVSFDKFVRITGFILIFIIVQVLKVFSPRQTIRSSLTV